MTRGPEHQRLSDYVTPAALAELELANKQWTQGAELLRAMAAELKAKAWTIQNSGDEDWSGDAATAAVKAFELTAERMADKSDEMVAGGDAFGLAWDGITTAQGELAAIEGNATGDFPSKPATAADPTSEEAVKAQTAYDTAVGDYWAKYHANEDKARIAIAALQTNHQEQAKVFQKIHGEPPPPPPPPPPGGGNTPVTPGTPTPISHIPGGNNNGNDTDPPPIKPPPTPICPGIDPPLPPTNHPEPPLPPTPPPNPPTPPTPPTGLPAGPGGTTPLPGAPVSTGGGYGAAGGLGAAGGGALGAAAVAGLAGGSGLGGLMAGSPGGRGLSSAGVRGIGTSGRGAGAGSVLGRGAGAGAGRGVGAGGMAGRGGGGAGRGAGGRGTGKAGTRGAAGSRAGAGAGAGAGGRGSGKDKKGRSSERDLFDDGKDWIDDEDAAPGVLD